MTKLNMDHITAIVHAEFYLQKRMHMFMEPSHLKQCDDDLLRLAEIKLHIIGCIQYECDLFEEESKEHGNRNRPNGS